jgi:hypothetical protein
MAKTAQAVIETKVKDGASQGFQKFRNEMKKTEKQGKVLNQQFRFMRGGMGQVGHQVQDIAVQLQMGQNAMLVFGQQGSQIASLFGPQGALIGAVLAVGAALSMALLPRLFGATQAAKDLKSTMKALADDFDNLTEAQKKLVRTQVKKQIADNNALLMKQRRELNDLTRITLSFNRIFFSGSKEEQKERIEELGASIDVLKQSNIDLNASIDDTTDVFLKQEEKLEKQIATFGLAASAVRAYEIGVLISTGKITEAEGDILFALSEKLAAEENAAKASKKNADMQKKAIRDLESEASKHYKSLEKSAQGFANSIGDGFVNAITGAMSFKDAMKNVAKSVINDLTKMIIKKQITDRIFGAIMGFMDATSVQAPNISQASLHPKLDAALKLPDLPALEGGGFTGRGARSGGVDGRGGFPAILHPNETVVDHTRGQGMGTVVNQTINISTGVSQTVRAEISNLMPQIQEATKAAVADSRARGGSYSKALLGV